MTSGVTSTSCAVTDLQVDLQALVVDFCLESYEMELLCHNQGGLRAAYFRSKQTSTKVSFEQEKENIIQEGSAYVAICPAAVATSLFSQCLQKKQDVSARLQVPNLRT